ncbi:MAG: hypothetical protein VKL39_13865, partial [Leptolyngbyaceae bacterium]|nr:hypothetical protein [Leptolyngbyaceae bacterium]
TGRKFWNEGNPSGYLSAEAGSRTPKHHVQIFGYLLDTFGGHLEDDLFSLRRNLSMLTGVMLTGVS